MPRPFESSCSWGWVKRGVWIGGMEFQRCRPTEYTYAAYDHVNDARLWKTFKTVFGVNNVTDSSKGVALGDPAIVMILNTKDDHTYDNYTFGANVQNPTWKDGCCRAICAARYAALPAIRSIWNRTVEPEERQV